MTAQTSDDHGFASVAYQYRTQHPDDIEGQQRIRAAYEVANEAHAGQRRSTGEPYIIHPVAVALTVAELGMDADTIAAALCHDVVEDTSITVEEIAEQIGTPAAVIVDGVTKLKAVSSASKEEANASSLRKLLLAATDDPRVLVVKIADRLHNASTLAPLSESKRRRVAAETLEVYAPLAHRLGMNETTAELEDYAFAALEPELFAEISARIDAAAPGREEKLEHIIAAAVSTLDRVGIPAVVTGRKKHVYSTYRKTVVRKQPFDEIADLIGIRVIVNSVNECYTALGVLHNTFTPVPGRFRDYIAQPRFGHYQSLHTTISVGGILTEVQLRTWKMHAAAEQGIAAHWRYKDQAVDANAEPKDPMAAPHLPWLANLLESGAADEASPGEFLASVRSDLGVEEVVVFTPTGKPVALPATATALDAAYAVHTEVGNHALEARVNGTPVPLGQPLKPGDQFEIVTSTDVTPTEDRLALVATGRARHAINAALNSRRRTERQTGSELLSAALRRAGVGRGWRAAADLDQVAHQFDLDRSDTLLEAIGCGDLDADNVAGAVHALLSAPGAGPRLVRPLTSSRPGAVTVEGHDDAVLAHATCCQTSPGAEAVGVHDPSGVVTVHASDCLTLATADAPLLDVTVPNLPVSASAYLSARGIYRKTLLLDVASAVAEAGADVVSLLMRTSTANMCVLRLTVAGHSDTVVERTLKGLLAVDGIYAARREE